MAETISLTLSGARQGNIAGDNTQTSLSRANTIEVLSFTQSLRSAFDRASGRATGRRFYEPIAFTKQIDKSTPLLRSALITNEAVSGTFRWFRPDPSGNGTTQHFLTITFSGARLTTAKLVLPDTLTPDTANLPPMEVVEMVFDTIEWTYLIGNITMNDTWDSSL
jgi:type VI secretion system secreted protein Hcp